MKHGAKSRIPNRFGFEKRIVKGQSGGVNGTQRQAKLYRRASEVQPLNFPDEHAGRLVSVEEFHI